MKKAIQLVLLYFVMQIVAVLTVMLIDLPLQYFVYHRPITADATLSPWTTVVIMLLGFVYMTIYLWHGRYLRNDGRIYKPTTLAFLGLTLVAGVSTIYIVDFLTSFLAFLPDINVSTFDVLESSAVGILCVVVLGPVTEELLFRGAITRELLRRFSPRVAILWSGVLFGVAHINPAQVVTACLMGILLAWLFVKTRSLVPGLLLHVVNNGLSVVLSATYPDATTLTELLSPAWTAVLLAVSAVLLIVSLRLMSRY